MKSKLIIIAILIAGSFTAFGQAKLSEEQKKEFKAQLDAYNAKLNLNEEQAKKMEEINLEYFEGLADLRNSTGSKLSRYKKYKSLDQERDSKAKKILTADQYKIYLQHQQEMTKALRERRGNR